MAYEHDISQDKTPGDLAREALLFLTHTLVAFVLPRNCGRRHVAQPPRPRLLKTQTTRHRPRSSGPDDRQLPPRPHPPQQHRGLHLDLRPGHLLHRLRLGDRPANRHRSLRNCGAIEKLWRTFFTFSYGSGLMGGDGLLVGAWIPLSMIGYALGARFALEL